VCEKIDLLIEREAPLTHEQLDLFNNATFRTTDRQEQLTMDATALNMINFVFVFNPELCEHL
jgi:hypothetical protein